MAINQSMLERAKNIGKGLIKGASMPMMGKTATGLGKALGDKLWNRKKMKAGEMLKKMPATGLSEAIKAIKK